MEDGLVSYLIEAVAGETRTHREWKTTMKLQNWQAKKTPLEFYKIEERSDYIENWEKRGGGTRLPCWSGLRGPCSML